LRHFPVTGKKERVQNIMELKLIKLKDLRPNPYQPRENFDKGKLEELASSIKQLGVLEPLLVKGDGEIIAGERRYRAALMAKVEDVPCMVVDSGSSLETREMSFAENFHRVDLSSPEVEKFVGQLWDEGGPEAVDKDGRKNPAKVRYSTISALATRLGLARETVGYILDSRKTKADLDLATSGITYHDVAETVALSDLPEQRKQVLELRDAEKISQPELAKFSEVVANAPELVKYSVELKKQGRDVKEIEEKVAFVRKAPEALKKEIIDVDLYKPVTAPIVAVPITPLDVSNMQDAVAEERKKAEARRADQSWQERDKLRKNWMSHTTVVKSQLSVMFDPENPEDDWTHLKWEKSGLTLQDAAGVAQRKFEEAVRKAEARKK